MKRLAVLSVALCASGDRRLWGCSPVALLIFVIELTVPAGAVVIVLLRILHQDIGTMPVWGIHCVHMS